MDSQIALYAAGGTTVALLAIRWATRRLRSHLAEAPVSEQWLADQKRRDDPE